MTQASLLDLPAPSKPRRVDLVADYFRARPGQWIDGLVFEAFAGRYGWRSRIADCRREFGMRIDNRVRVLDGGRKVSEYIYLVPTVSARDMFTPEGKPITA